MKMPLARNLLALGTELYGRDVFLNNTKGCGQFEAPNNTHDNLSKEEGQAIGSYKARRQKDMLL